MSADPFVQNISDAQDFNRYGYVGNNPLSVTDPTGHFKFWHIFVPFLGGFEITREILKAVPILGKIAEIAAFAVCTAYSGGNTLAGAGCSSAIAAINTGIVTGSLSEALKAGSITFAQGAAFYGIGTVASIPARIALSAAVGGLTSVVQGGNFVSDFLAAGFGAGVGSLNLGGHLIAPALGNATYDGLVVSAVAGGVGSLIGGGKFANGAVTGAFAYIAGNAAQRLARSQPMDDGSGVPDDIRDWVIKNPKLKLETVDGILKGTVSVGCAEAQTFCNRAINAMRGINSKGRIELNINQVREASDITVGIDLTLPGAGRTIGWDRILINTNRAGFAYETTVLHEFGHIVGYGHQPPGSGSIMSYDNDRAQSFNQREMQWAIDAYR